VAIVAADWEVTRASGNIRYIGADHGGVSPSYATVIEFHRWLQDLADDASSAGDDQVDITDENPSNRSTDNIITLLGLYNIDDNAAEHLYDGSIIQDGGDVIYDGIVNFGNSDVQIQLIQDGAVLTDDWWNFGGGGLNADANAGISHRFMIKVRTAAADIDGRRLIGITRTFGNTYSEFSINGTSRGNNVLALSDTTDLNNQTAAGTVATWDQFTNTNQGYSLLDINNDGSTEPFYSTWAIGGGTTPASPTINNLYEWTKYVSRDGSASTLYGISGELFRGITHQWNYDNELSGPFTETELLTWTGGSARLLALLDSGTTGTMWVQLISGTAPANDTAIAGATSLATADVNGTFTTRPVSTPFIGVSTGSAIIGAFGLGIDPTDLSQADSLTALTGTTYSPPNFVTFSVGGLVSGEDRVLVGPWDGISVDNEGNPAVDIDQLTLNTTLSGATETAVVVTTAIPGDTPNSGTIRIELDSGLYRLQAYSSWTGSTFTIPSTDYSGANQATATNNVWISYLDKLAAAATESFTGVYGSDRNLVVKVRDGGGTPIKEFISSAVLGSAGGSVTAIRTSDL
jgi:hypothetical protein